MDNHIYSSMRTYYDMCVLILSDHISWYLSMWSSYFYIFVLILPYVSSYYYICCVLILIYVSYYYTCVLILQFVCSNTTICVSSYYYRCVLMLLYMCMCSHTAKVNDFYKSYQTKSPSYTKGSASKGSSFTGKATSYLWPPWEKQHLASEGVSVAIAKGML